MEQKRSIDKYIWTALMILTPFLLFLICGAVIGITKKTVPIPGIQWNDEAAYIKLIQTCVKTGQPVGYWGFDGNHAILGTGSAWSPAILWPYAIFAFLFPVGQSFVFWVNLFYITLANALFVLLARPGKRALLCGICVQATSAVLILYLNTNMSELFRFSIAIILAGMFYRLFFLESPKWLKFAVVPLFILYAVQVYIFFAFCIPIYVFAVLRKRKLWLKLAVGAGSMGILTGLSYVFLHLISSNYNIAKTESLLAALKAGQIGGAVIAYARMLKGGIAGVFGLWTYIFAYPLYPFYVLASLVLAVISIILILASYKRRRTQKEDGDGSLQKNQEETEIRKRRNVGKNFTIGMIIAYSIIIFFFMYLSLYTIVPDTFMRGTYIVVIFSLYLLIMADRSSFIWAAIIIQAGGLFLMAPNWKDFTLERYGNMASEAEWRMLAEDFSEVMQVNKGADPWENTVSMNTMEPRVVCAVPAGLGVNFILTDDIFPTDAEYLVFSKRSAEELRPDWVEKDYNKYLTDFGAELGLLYDIIYDKGDILIYQRK